MSNKLRQDFFSVIQMISAIFSVKKKSESCNDLFERGCRCFQLFYFLTRIIPVQILTWEQYQNGQWVYGHMPTSLTTWPLMRPTQT